MKHRHRLWCGLVLIARRTLPDAATAFNLDHGTELVSGVQYSKGPYFADQGDFTTAGSANINYASVLDRPIVRAGGGDEGFGRAIVAASPAVGSGHLLAALEVGHDDGPWSHPDDYRKVNGVVRYSRGDAVNGLSVTGMGYRATWNSTDQVPLRATESNIIDRFGALENTVGVQLRNDDITNIGLYHTEARQRLATTRQDSVLQTSGAVYAQNDVAWTPWLRTLAGLRLDGYPGSPGISRLPSTSSTCSMPGSATSSTATRPGCPTSRPPA